MTAKTRRQKAALASQTGENDTLPSGNGSVKNQLEKDASPVAQDDMKENVFLFAPNLIGRQAFSFWFIPMCSFET